VPFDDPAQEHAWRRRLEEEKSKWREWEWRVREYEASNRRSGTRALGVLLAAMIAGAWLKSGFDGARTGLLIVGVLAILELILGRP
jgi:hypothetical protein